MMIFGHRFIPNNSFYHVINIEGISNTPPSSTIYLTFNEQNLDIINHAKLNDIQFALEIENLRELIYASALGASYIITTKQNAKIFQEIAENYLFDAKILVHIEKDEEIEIFAKEGIDGVIYSNAIIKINS